MSTPEPMQTRLDRVIQERDEAQAQLAEAMFWLTAIVASERGEIRVNHRLLTTIRRDAVIERYDDPISREVVWRVQE